MYLPEKYLILAPTWRYPFAQYWTFVLASKMHL